jgi:hypothetical protein
MYRPVFIAALVLAIVVSGCATGSRPTQQAAEEEWPSGPGTIPPSWYDYNPAYKHWFDPWYHNPYIGGF